MDFALFMEKYGYKILGLLLVIIVIVVLAFPFLGLLKFLRENWEVAGVLILLILITSFFRRKYYQAYGEALGRYFYDDKFGKRP
ncbi:hypothetical protein PFDSM3638_03380 [Pyrococcus furiosus DSM 3638]|uniref:Uncharacterized protein n=3 Tax=Pyrococcus furiosus TaxID=2261 RepID=A0A5C0XPJ0_PYRFU|nr:MULTISPECIES: hypothetical protein [Pyrococcus]AAL80799.1 hypothetical protein PF0675 [Pyrococcus furiosus DSM 3638]AFN03469.1 hypothetical protein PFC_02535 [Pyrococcus furiosus COM1]MDK2869910.1 hypothetical protein [Pyrococcus sp.]QEK78375.1 hypothetical protein PFDSM3638_03380 [Pyrococcus furiosus DSM 3638]